MLNSRPVYGDADTSARITLGVCTFQRPQMLMECLASVAQLKAPDNTEVSFVVIDNEVSERTRDIVGIYAAQSNHPMRYVAEPRRGISHARNAVIDAALADGADWVAMLDDDQVVKPFWLRQMLAAQKRGEADVVKSSVAYEYPDPMPDWVFPENRSRKLQGRYDLETTQTNGVLFRACLVRPRTPDGRNLGLRFDERYALSYGEDRDFFRRAFEAGAFMLQTPDAVATEFVPSTKCSFSAQVARTYWAEVTNMHQDCRFYGVLHTMFSQSLRFANKFIGGLLVSLAAPFAMAVRPRYGRKLALKGARKLAACAGVCVGVLRLTRPQPYLTIHGS